MRARERRSYTFHRGCSPVAADPPRAAGCRRHPLSLVLRQMLFHVLQKGPRFPRRLRSRPWPGRSQRGVLVSSGFTLKAALSPLITRNQYLGKGVDELVSSNRGRGTGESACCCATGCVSMNSCTGRVQGAILLQQSELLLQRSPRRLPDAASLRSGNQIWKVIQRIQLCLQQPKHRSRSIGTSPRFPLVPCPQPAKLPKMFLVSGGVESSSSSSRAVSGSLRGFIALER